MPHPPHLPPRLLVADQVAGRISLLDLPDGDERAALHHRHLAEHAGFLALPDDLLACVDDRAGELLVLDPYGPDTGRPWSGAEYRSPYPPSTWRPRRADGTSR